MKVLNPGFRLGVYLVLWFLLIFHYWILDMKVLHPDFRLVADFFLTIVTVQYMVIYIHIDISYHIVNFAFNDMLFIAVIWPRN